MKSLRLAIVVGASLAPGATSTSLRGRLLEYFRSRAEPEPSTCGAAPTYENAKPKNYADSKTTFYNTETKKTEPVVFKAGDEIEFICEAGYTTDGSKDGVNTYKVKCAEQGYYVPDGVCVQASKCGKLPNVTHAAPTGKTSNGKVEFACAQGYSLDGEKVVSGGFGKNRFFELQCQEFSGAYEEFTGECKPYAFAPAKETIRIYNQVTEALFIASCKGTLKVAFSKGEAPAGLDNVCSNFADSSAACSGLVSQIKSDFESKLSERKTFDEQNKKDWYDEAEPGRPHINEEAETFCVELWKLLAMPSL